MKNEALIHFLTYPFDYRPLLRLPDVLIYNWLEGKHACVDVIGFSLMVGFGAGQQKWRNMK